MKEQSGRTLESDGRSWLPNAKASEPSLVFKLVFFFFFFTIFDFLSLLFHLCTPSHKRYDPLCF